MEVTLIPKSRKAFCRVGKSPVTGVVEQIKDRKVFVVLSPSHFRWVQLEGDPDFEVRLQ